MEKTVIVLGAGASAPFAFPTAWELRELIIGRLSNRFKSHFSEWEHYGNDDGLKGFIEHEVRPHLGDSNTVKFKNLFDRSNVASIDTWLRKNEDFAAVGKAYIASLLLACEHHSVKHGKWKGDWYTSFWNRIIKADVDVRHLSIVTFNYDRSLEYFLLMSAMAYLGDSSGREFLKNLTIDHVYGSLGELEGEKAIDMGDVQSWRSAALQIHTIRPGKIEKTRIHQKIAEASRLIFLGFGFDADNLDVLGLTEGQSWKFEVLATCSNLDVDSMRKAERRFANPIKWGAFSMNCEEFFKAAVEI